MEAEPVGRAVARYDYEARDSEEITVQGGDELLIYGSFEEVWWMALSTKSGEKGYVPSNYCIKLNDLIEPKKSNYTSVILTARDTDAAGDSNGQVTRPIQSENTQPPPRPPKRPPRTDSVRRSLNANENADNGKKVSYMNPSPEIYRVLEDYGIYENFEEEHSDFSVNAGDEVEVLDKKGDGIWRCRSLYTNEIGFISKKDLTKHNPLEYEDYFIGKQDREATEKLLLSSGNTDGCYVVRESDGKDVLVLSIIKSLQEKKINHYKIKKDDSSKYYIYSDKSFLSVQELIKHCKDEGGLLDKVFIPYKKDHHAWDIPAWSIKTQAMLGSGNFGTVYRAVWTAQRRSIDVAVKTSFDISTPKMMEDFKAECTNMRKLRHPCLVRLYGICTKKKLMLVMEMFENGDLKTYLETDNVGRTELFKLLQFCYQTSCGMAYLESQGIVHRDLAARNILLDKDYNIKIADFGLSRVLLDGKYRGQSNTFPTKWTAIEYFEKKIYTMKCDVWSYGILTWEIFSFGEEPYEDMEASKEIQDFLKGGNRLSKPVDCPNNMFQTVMTVCWEKDPNKRPNFAEIKDTMRRHTERSYANLG